MDLQQWIISKKYCVSEVARRLGVSRSTLQSILDGISAPRLELAYKIILFTRNEVTLEDLVSAARMVKERRKSEQNVIKDVEVPDEFVKWKKKLGD